LRQALVQKLELFHYVTLDRNNSIGVDLVADSTTGLSAHFRGFHTVIGCTGFVDRTYERLADMVDSVLGRKVRRVEWSVPVLKDELVKEPNKPIKKYRVVFAQGRGVSWEVDRTFNAQRGIEVMGVERWARENLK
jgi:hypothetical protein